MSLAGTARASAAQAATPSPDPAAPAVAGAKPLGLEECLAAALKNSHRRPASQFGVAMAEAQHRQALAGYWPQVSFQGGYQRLDQPLNSCFQPVACRFPPSPSRFRAARP